MVRAEIKYENSPRGREEALTVIDLLMPLLKDGTVEKITEEIDIGDSGDKKFLHAHLKLYPAKRGIV